MPTLINQNPNVVSAYNALTPAEQATFQQKSPDMFNVSPQNQTPTSAGITTGVGIAPISADEQALADAEKAKINPAVDENTIRQNQTQMFQKEIDALNAVYANQKLEATQAGMGRLGSDASIQARRGLLGSSFGGAQTESVNAVNSQEQSAIDAEQAAKMAVITRNLSSSVADEISKKRQAASEGADSLVNYLKGTLDRKNTRASNYVKDLITGNVAPTDKELQDAATQLGVDVSVLKNSYAAAKKENDATLATKTAANTKTTLDNQLISANIANKNADTNKLLNDAKTSNDWGSISNNDKTDIVNWLQTQPDFTQADLERAKTDRNVQAAILKQVQTEKAAVSNPFQ